MSQNILRLLYANVCFLCTNSSSGSNSVSSNSSSSTCTNLMTVSWLIPVDNIGSFSESILNKQSREDSLTNINWDVLCVSECPAHLACLVTRVLSPDHNDHVQLSLQLLMLNIGKMGNYFHQHYLKVQACYPS